MKRGMKILLLQKAGEFLSTKLTRFFLIENPRLGQGFRASYSTRDIFPAASLELNMLPLEQWANSACLYY